MSDAKRLTRHELQEPDPFVAGMDDAFQYVRTHRNRVIAIGLGVLAAGILAAAVFAWRSYSERSANEALLPLLKLESRPAGAAAPAAVPVQGEPFATQTAKDAAILEESTRFLERHGSSGPARIARMLKAEALARQGTYAEAASLFAEVAGSVPNDALGGAAALAHARTLAAKGEVDAAIEKLTKLASAHNAYVPADLALDSAAHLAETAGRKDQAAQLYKRLADDIKDSAFAAQARRKAAELAPAASATAAATPATAPEAP